MKQLPRDWIDPGGRLSEQGLRHVLRRKGSVLLESNLERKGESESLVFVDPVSVIETSRLEEVEGSLLLLDTALKDGYSAAGYLAYEAGLAFEQTLPSDRLPSIPLLWFGIYEKPLRISYTRGAPAPGERRQISDGVMPQFSATVSEEQYDDALASILQYIAAGDTYQVNYTFRLHFPLHLPVHKVYARLRSMQRSPYSALLNTGSHAILSFSPELFFRRDGSKIVLRPMKGTAPRGRTTSEDHTNRLWLESSEKNRAENLMIVDLLRNDLGKLAQPGSVSVKRFFEVERYETVFQATSTIEGTLRKEVSDADVLRAFFPSGSVTGAPKIRTMQIIRELERDPRGVYTGAIGYLSPKGKTVFNVAIRTVVLDRKTKTAEFGVGSGVVHDSGSKEEYGECLLKARFLYEPSESFELFETIRWEPRRGFHQLRRHLARLKDSAAYFGFPFPQDRIGKALEAANHRLARKQTMMRVRLSLADDGSVRTEARTLEPLIEPAMIALSKTSTHTSNRHLFHKTTRRGLYDQALTIANQKGFFDIVFRNEQGEITEGARSNVVLRVDRSYVTPPLSSGILAGTYRDQLMKSRKFRLTERVIYPDDLMSADEVFLCNALRGLVKVRLSEEEIILKGEP